MIYDITLPLSPALGGWPGDPPVVREPLGMGTKMARWSFGNHAGTHVDAPAHLHPDAPVVRDVDPEALLGPCRVLDLSGVEQITAEALRGQPLAGVERVLLRTRNSARWGRGAWAFDPDYAALDAGAAARLRAAGVRLVGVDGLSADVYDSALPAHRTLLGAGVILLEGCNLAEVPAGDYTLICAPLALDDADGAPARVWLVRA